MNMNKKKYRLLLVVITLVVVVTLITIIAFDALQQEVLLGHITRLRLHMTLAALHVRERGVEGGTELIPCLLMQPFVRCLSFCRQPTKDHLVTQRFPSFAELCPEILGCSFTPACDQNLPVTIVAFDELPLSRLPAGSLLGGVHRFPIDNRNGMVLDIKEGGPGPVLRAIVPHPIQRREILFDVSGKRD